ncbi:MAG: glycoside hydrolase family 88 protein [Phycisphaerae bacterium]|nr:glycoside hydrolase family 88 protein [Phycisphaerae bacterium]
MMKNKLLTILIISTAITSGCNAENTPPLQPAQIKTVMTRVADWQLANPSKHETTDWTHGALFAGLTAHAQMAETNKYHNALLNFGEKNAWQPHKRINNVYHADDHAVAQMYIEMYKKYKDPKMIAPIQQLYDYILANQPDTPLTHDKNENKKRFNWCDALFMAPPVWAKLARITGEQKYLDYMNKEWWATTDYLFDTDEDLYFRDDRFFEKREANGKKVFWSRGNGWVFGGLVRVLEEMPEDYPDRAKYVDIYKKMAAKIVKIQPAEGMWHSSLLDPVTFGTKEASGSGFYCYGLAWGINHGLLDAEKYLPAVEKAWVELVSCVHLDGKLGNVQPIGADPRKVTDDQTEVYGVGAFLLAGSEVYKIAVLGGGRAKSFTVVNPINSFRDTETISLNWDDIKGSVKGLTKSNVGVFEFKSNRFLAKQIVEDGGSTEVLFQTNFAPGEKKYFRVMVEPKKLIQAELANSATSRFVPERKDDFAWENDKVGFRMYGPALEDETITCGIDTFGKSVPYLIMEKMLTTKGYIYHKDQGEGGDFYKVGNTLGCGGAAPFIDGKVCLAPKNFSEWKIVANSANGGIRTVFELTYAPWKAGSVTVSEKKRITLDMGSNLNKIECFYSCDDKKNIPVAAGIILQKSSDKKFTKQNNIIAYWLPGDGKNGNIGCGVVFPAGTKAKTIEADGHLLMQADHDMAKPFVYYSGSCWDKNTEFNTFEKWQKYLNGFKERVDNPVVINYE